MKTITSLSKYFFVLVFFQFFLSEANSQVQVPPCNDVEPPILTSCGPLQEIYITDPTQCSIAVDWDVPTASDICIRTNMFHYPFTRWFTYYDEGVFGANGQLNFFNDSMVMVGVTNGLGPRVFQACFYATCTGTLSFNYRARMNNGDGFIGDRARFMLQNALTNTNTTTILTPGNGNYATGSITVNVGMGDRVCFEVQSDNIFGVDSLTIANLIFTSQSINVVQTYGPRPGDLLEPGYYIVGYYATDCAGNGAFCDHSIHVNPAPNHVLSNCSRDTIIYLPDPSNCDTLLDGLIPIVNNYCTSYQGLLGTFYPSAHSTLTFPTIYKEGLNHDPHAGTDGLAVVSPTGDLMMVGTSNGTPPDPLLQKFDTSFVEAHVYIPCAGTVTFDWSAMMRRILATFFYDEAGYRIYDPVANTYTYHALATPPLGNSASGSEVINFPNNAEIVFFVKSGNFGFQDTFNITNFVFTPDPTQLNQTCGPDLTLPVGPGVYDLCYDATDCFGTREVCNFKLTVINDYPLACKDINLSLDSLCTARVTPGMLLAGGGCTNTMVVELSHYGNPISNPVDTNFLNKHIIGKVRDTLNGYSCWSNILIEDKLAPGIICKADTLDCYRFEHDLPLQYEGYDCSRYSVTATGDRTEHLTCDDLFLKKVYRDIKITDATGNVSECTDTICVRRIEAKDLYIPTGIYEFYCDSRSIFDRDGHPNPAYTGLPYFYSEGNVIVMYDLNLLLPCNVLVTYDDIDLGEINCVRKIMRTWTVREWWCNTEITRSELQVIIIKDIEGPTITHSPYDFSATTDHKGCYANVNLPPIEAVDNCHNKLRIDVVYPGGILIGKNGGLAQLPVGEDTIIYRVYDGCYNLTEDTLIVHVTDETEPIAICDRRTVVSLNGSGENWVPASVFDDGSFDECHLHHLEVRRMDKDYCGLIGEGIWAPEVPFCCNDVGKTIMVGMKAIDYSGNYAICMVMVEVQDKDKPRIIAPPDIDIDCRFGIDFHNLNHSFGQVVTDESLRDTIVIDNRYWHEIYGHPFDGIAYDNCDPHVIETIDTSGMNQCGMGTIIRKFVVVDNFGNRDSAYQRIRIGNHHPMTDLSIVWPYDFETSNICDPNQLRPELLNDPYKFPKFLDDECSLVGVDYEDHIFSATVPGDPCYKIFREWKVIDWCYRNDSNEIVIFRDTQIIKVNNTVDPIITKPCRDTTICTYDVQCNPIPVTLSIDATDFCTNNSELLYRYKIDFNSDGTFDVNRAEIGNPTASGTWPLGRHIIKWEVEDRCGNTATCISQLNLINCKPPTAYAHRDLAIGLTGMDTDGDGAPDTKMAIVWASDLDAGSNHTCGYRLKLSFSKDTNDTRRVYTCDSIGPRNVELWATDINGNTSFVKTVIVINDNPNQLPLCPQNIHANVSGLITSTNNDKIEQVEVELTNSGLAKTVTNYEGEYSFGNMSTGGSYSIKPERNDEWLNGISTADIIKIQKHILGKELLTSGYQMLAADVNNSKTVTSADIAELRKLILGITSSVSKNTSWRFVNANYSFSNVENALNEAVPESYDISKLSSDIKANFIGIKIGDLTNNAKTRGLGGKIVTRSSKVMDLSFENIPVHQNEVYEVHFGSKNINDFQGFQMTLEMNPSLVEMLEVVGNKSQKLSEDNINAAHILNGRIAISWNNETAKKDEALFTVKFRSKVEGRLMDLLQLNSSVTQSLSVDKEGEEGNIQLRSYNGFTNEFLIMQNEPNPWKQSTSIGMILPRRGEVVMTIYDLTGKVFYKELRQMEKGYSDWIINRSEIPGAGVYYYQVDFETNTKTNKMIVVE